MRLKDGVYLQKKENEMKDIKVCGAGKCFNINVNGKDMHVGLAGKAGQTDTDVTPLDLFVASLAACAGVFGVRYLETAKLNTEGFEIVVNWDYSEDKTRIGRIDLDIKLPNTELGGRKKAFFSAVDQCIVRNTIRQGLDINIKVDGQQTL